MPLAPLDKISCAGPYEEFMICITKCVVCCSRSVMVMLNKLNTEKNVEGVVFF